MMSPPITTTPDTILAHVRVLRIVDRLLDLTDELREARDKLQTHLETGDHRAEAQRDE